MSYTIKLLPSGHTFQAKGSQTILEAAIDAGVHLPYGCRNGACGACKGKVLEGRVHLEDYQSAIFSEEENKNGMTLFCRAIATENLTIEIKELRNTNNIKPKIFPVRVEALEKLTYDVMLMKLKLPSTDKLQFVAGQYFEFLLKDGKRRAFSIASPSHESTLLEVHLRLIPGGEFTEYVFKEMKEKSILRVEGPFGNFFLREDSKKPIIFVAGGTGFAPIKGMIEESIKKGMKRPIKLYRGARILKDLYMDTLCKKWAQELSHIEYIPVLSESLKEDKWEGREGLVHEVVLKDFVSFNEYQLYCCGAPQMVELAHNAFISRGLPEDEFYSDAFTFQRL
jgi:CDP-4-dehydro-6-deoxyglucose reductase